MDNCEYCGKANESNGFFIGAKLDSDDGFTMVEGAGKMACGDCYPRALKDARLILDRMVK